MNTTAFITGSTAYGTPREDSDVDMVVMLSPEEAEALNELGENVDESVHYSGAAGLAIRLGKLNLIVVTSLERYRSWRAGTDAMVTASKRGQGYSFTRDQAIAVFKGMFANELAVKLSSDPDELAGAVATVLVMSTQRERGEEEEKAYRAMVERAIGSRGVVRSCEDGAVVVVCPKDISQSDEAEVIFDVRQAVPVTWAVTTVRGEP